MTKNASLFVALFGLTVVLFGSTLLSVADLALNNEHYAQAALAPGLCLFFLFRERSQIFAPAWRISPTRQALTFGGLLAVFLAARYFVFDATFSLTAKTALLVSLWLAAFLASWGPLTFRAALFPLGCLLLVIPPPQPVLDGVVSALQHSSAALSAMLFRLAGIHFYVEGTRFSLPGVEIDVAPECSGIRSTTVFSLASLFVGRISLRSGWKQFALVILTIAISILKNAARITTIASLGAFVNRAFLFGSLHRNGGLVFAVLGVALFVPVYSALVRSESPSVQPPNGH